MCSSNAQNNVRHCCHIDDIWWKRLAEILAANTEELAQPTCFPIPFTMKTQSLTWDLFTLCNDLFVPNENISKTSADWPNYFRSWDIKRCYTGARRIGPPALSLPFNSVLCIFLLLSPHVYLHQRTSIFISPLLIFSIHPSALLPFPLFSHPSPFLSSIVCPRHFPLSSSPFSPLPLLTELWITIRGYTSHRETV